MGVRWYDPALGRWTSPDSIVPEPNEPQSLNRLSWVRGNPLKFVDPTGQKEEEACSLSDEECEDDEIFWDSDYCSENPESTWCQPSVTPTEAIFWFVVGVGGVELAVGVLEVGGVHVLEVLGAASADGDPTNEVQTIQTGANTVYRYVQDGVTRYIGITQDFARRAGEHLCERGWTIEPIPGLDQLSRFDARAVEQVLIEFYELGNLYNKINGIAPSNPIYRMALERGGEILRIIGFGR
jgi:hypothetical protein